MFECLKGKMISGIAYMHTTNRVEFQFIVKCQNA